MVTTVGEDLPELVLQDDDRAIVDLLREIQRAVLCHPEAGRALYLALVKEGRAFAQTAAGQQWKARLQRSALLERALLVWQSATLWTTEDAGDAPAPTALIDAVASAAASPRRDELLDQLFRQTDLEP